MLLENNIDSVCFITYNLIVGDLIMKLYLSSYKLGNQTKFLTEWLQNSNNKKIALIPDARDVFPDGERKQKGIEADATLLRELGFDVTIIKLKDYFNKKEELKEALSSFQAFFTIGGNVFVLRQAMALSGFDAYIKTLTGREDYLYAGYSAGICVLAPSLKGIHLVDDPSVSPYELEPIYEGLNIIPFTPVPHYKSDHPESIMMNQVIDYLKQQNHPFITLQDGDVMIEDTLTKEME